MVISGKARTGVFVAVAAVIGAAFGWAITSSIDTDDGQSPEFVEFQAIVSSAPRGDSWCLAPTEEAVRSSLGEEVCGEVALRPGESPGAGDVVRVSWFRPDTTGDLGERDVMVLDVD